MAPFGTENWGRDGGRWLEVSEREWITEVENGTLGRPVPIGLRWQMADGIADEIRSWPGWEGRVFKGVEIFV
jgi:hypothetical protein